MDFFSQQSIHLPEYFDFTEAVLKQKASVNITGAAQIGRAYFLASLALEKEENFHEPIIVLVSSEGEGARLCEDINVLCGRRFAFLYPAKELSLRKIEVVSKEYEHRRLSVLTRILKGERILVVATFEAAAQLTIPQEIMKKNSIFLSQNGELSYADFIARLSENGYSRTDMVEGVSQFSVRGGIVDVFPVNTEKPIRAEFFGDDIDSINFFDTETQRRTEPAESVVISPANEIIFSDMIELRNSVDKLLVQVSPVARKRIGEETEKLFGGISINSDKFLPLAYKKAATLFDYTGAIVLCEESSVFENAKSAYNQHLEDLQMLFSEHELCKGLDRYMLSVSEFSEIVSKKKAANLENFFHKSAFPAKKQLNVEISQMSAWNGSYDAIFETVTEYFSSFYHGIVFAGTEKNAKIIAEELHSKGISADFSNNPKKIFAKHVYIVPGTISSGFVFPTEKFFVITHTAISVSAKQPPKKKKREAISSLDDISVGDLVVHNSHGIGVFEGVQKLTGAKVTKDYIKIKYLGTDVLYVPVTQLDLISRYIGSGDANTVRLNKLHSDVWQKTKTKAKAAAKEMAEELIILYAKRMSSKGFAFSKDDSLQEDFENHFSYIETDDQLRSAAEIKADMEQIQPMERLLCGDVGFGKTEVALRAAFKCVADGKQCAILCPTTVLSWQHYQTVLKRMGGFPINVELLSRFRSPSEQKVIITKLKKGTVDIVIGTHRLVQSDIKFKDLGLVIIDEEQRFGVAQKDKFKENFPGVDILSLSATPIPRTLNMAMSGIRDMSVIETPPGDRQSITTYVMEQDDGIIANAVAKELRRGGQVYYIHNRVETIHSCAAHLSELCEGIRIGIAHGKMGEEELLSVWQQLVEQEIDMLVCTTLIETGIDVPNVNTLIIENADHLGLAQLHQLRGRIGRSNRRAYAYFTFKKGKVVSEIASKRLAAIREFTKFGSGFKIAMKDLEIRGAGSLLGESQSGHMSAVGYNMYVKLLSEAVAEERGEAAEIKNECLVDIKINAYIPESFISSPAGRISCYKKIASITSEEEALDVTDELIDRYGDVPESVGGLIQVAVLRNLAQKCKVYEITQTENEIFFYMDKIDFEKASRLGGCIQNKFVLNLTGKISIKVYASEKENPLLVIKNVLMGIL